jgi:LacI family transcriptional regulator
MARVTIKDIAKHAGVSTATVSYVINQSRYVSPELTERVTAAIEQLGYYPDDNARSLRSKRTSMIGLIVPDNANPFFAEVAKGVEDAGFEAGYTVILCNSNAMLERELAYLDVLQSRRVDGIIVLSTSSEVDHLRPVVERGVPTIVFYREVSDMDVDALMLDNQAAGYLATQHLIDLGHRDIACIKPLSPTNPSARRVAGYQQAMEDNDLVWHPALMPQGNNLISGGAEATDELLASGRPFTAIFACNDAMAIGAMRSLRDSGYRIPDDVSIVGFDDIILATYTNPPLTTIASPKQEAGRFAVERLLERIEEKHDGGLRTFTLDTELIVRGSTAAPPQSQE